jgi:hypothetical protein
MGACQRELRVRVVNAHHVRAAPRQFAGENPSAAANVEHSLPSQRLNKIRQQHLRREQLRAAQTAIPLRIAIVESR